MRFSQMAGVLIGVFIFGPVLWAAEKVDKSTASDQVSVEVTAYNSNLALVKDVRQVKLQEGEGYLQFMDVASSIQPETVRVRSVDHPEQLEFLEQNYEYDLISPQKLLEKYVGKTIKLSVWNQYQDRKEVVEATLLSVNNGPVYRIGGEIHLGHEGYSIVPEMPENLFARPTLSWLYKNKTAQTHRVETSYLAGNISWRADYVLVLNEKDTKADLSGWVTLDNRSGATYTQAKLKLVAGDVHVPAEKKMRHLMEEPMSTSMDARGSGFQEQSLFEYHLYDLQRPTTIRENQTKQISLLEASDIGVVKELLVYGMEHYFSYKYTSKNPKQSVAVYISFKNAKENALGMPLPKGMVRTYKQDASGRLQFVGADQIEHTPKDEEVRLKIGEAFDVVAERVQTDFRQITSRQYESAWEITLRNHKQEDVTVGLVEPIPGTWTILESSHSHVKKDAFTIRFDVVVPKDGEVKVSYKVRVGI